MAINQFYPFATGDGANVDPNATYEADPGRQTGQQAGLARSALNNDALRQATSVAAMIGQFIADNSGNAANDDGNTAALEASFTFAVRSVSGPSSVTVFNTAGTFTWTCPAGVFFVKKAIVTGGGGAGAPSNGSFPPTGSTDVSGGGGGAGGTAIGIAIPVVPGTEYTITVAAGGAGGDVSGGTSSFATFISATGGARSIFSSTASSAGGGPGVGIGGAINLSGGWGGDGQSGTVAFPGNGGSSYWGGGIRAFNGGGAAPATGAPGGGGGGSYASPVNTPGTNGLNGIVVLEY